MAIAHGRNTSVLLGSVDISTFCNSTEADNTVDETETTTYQAAGGAKLYIPGNESGMATLAGYVDMQGAPDTTGGDYLLRQALGGADRPLSIAWEGWAMPGSGAPPSKRVLMIPAAWEKSYKPKSPIGSALSWQAMCRGDGAIVGGIPLHLDTLSVAANEAANNANSTDLSAAIASASTAWVASLHVLSYSGFTSAVIKIFDSATGADGSFAQLASSTFTTVTGVTSQQLSVTGAVRRYVSIQSTFVGSGTIKYAVAFSVLGAGGAGL